MGTDAGLDEAPAPTEAPKEPKFERRPLGVSWLIGVVVIPLLLAALGYGAYQRPTSVDGPTGELPTVTASSAKPDRPELSLSLLSVSRSGNTLTLIGDFPNEDAKAALMTSLKGLLSQNVTVVDQIQIDPKVRALDFSNAEPVFSASGPIPDFTLKVERDTITLTGTAASPDQKDAVGSAATSVWSDVNVENQIEVKGQPAGSTPPTGPAATGACADLQAAVTALTGGAIAFGNDGVSLTPDSNKVLTQVVDKLRACPDAKVTVNGYTDNSGSEGLNIPLSAQRAQTVADFLVAHGVPTDHITAKGLGSANPIASNDTAEGRIKNRRVEIVVS
ncbi:outer membrane protein a OmpA [Mycobacterium marinum M]|uniref:Outer membrane protein a OmpA n=1 Tax=Mycobacterium marinum (strain ATCC BAA-535 / M) TaxID=216594 RepID=B2HF78_MYCMM|nr:OmpA family protein [Mycobacterium marinum]ACC43040.1 outer membrane protein a OmpA [Mycobacterium marinum M]